METALAQLKETILSVYTHLHENPEISWQEKETTDYLKTLLEAHGYRPELFPETTGLVVKFGSGTPTVAFRTDIDALWQQVGGVFQAHHSCGHDAHMAMAVGVLLLLKKLDYQPPGTIKIIFQPAEEHGTGALKLISLEVIDDVDYLYGVHLRPGLELSLGEAAPSLLHGSAAFIHGEIIGEDAHGGRPHLGTNAIEVGAALVNELSKIRPNPIVPSSVKLTKFQAGGCACNVIPGMASFSIDARAQTNETMDFLLTRIYHTAAMMAQLYGVEVNLQTTSQIAAAKPDQDAEAILAQAIVDTVGVENLAAPIVSSGGEDFHFYTLKKPELKATMLGLGCDLRPGLHHPEMTFNTDALFIGISILTKAMIGTFSYEEAKRLSKTDRNLKGE